MKCDNVLIVAITRMGDLLQASPTICGIKAHNPQAKITIVLDNQFKAICEGIPGVDEIISVDMNFFAKAIWQGGPLLVEGYKFVDKLVEDLKSRDFDLCINMSNSNYTAILISMLDIPENTGWLADEKGCRLMADPWSMLFTSSIYHSNRDYNSINLVDFFRSAAGVSKHPRGLKYETDATSDETMDQFLASEFLSDSGPLIAVQVGASQKKRQWSPKRFALLTQYLIEDLGARVVYTGAPSEQHLIEAVQEIYSNPQAVSAVGRTKIPELGSLLKRADLLITGDTGTMHLSVAVGTPVVALFLASALCFETGPYSAGNIVLQPKISCNPCNPNYPCTRPDCHDQISPELVVYLAKLRLSRPITQDMFLEIAPDIAPPTEIGVYVSEFDEEGYLKFRPINGLSEDSTDTARLAYRALWKQEFAGIPSGLVEESTENFAIEPDLRNAVESACNLIDEGLKLLKRLIIVAKDESAPAAELSEISAALTVVERRLEEISLTFPILGTIIRIFIIEKENLRGEDIFLLTKQSTDLYESLRRRLKMFLASYGRELRIEAVKEIRENDSSNC